MRTIQIYSNGTVNPSSIDSLEFDSDYGYYANMVHICNETYAIFYAGSSTDGEIVTLNISATGQIVPATENDVIDRLEKFEITFTDNKVLHLGDHVYGVVFMGTGGGMIQSFEISNSGIINSNPLEWFKWNLNYAYNVKAIYVGNNTYVLTHRGVPANQYEGVFRTLTIVTNKGLCKDNTYGIDADGSSVFGTINGQSISVSRSSGWNHVVLTYDKDDEQKLYLNGVLRSSRNGTISIDPDTGNLHVGQYFNGMIDEIRVSSSVRNASWIKTGYNTMNSPSTFLSFGSEDSPGAVSIKLSDTTILKAPLSLYLESPNFVYEGEEFTIIVRNSLSTGNVMEGVLVVFNDISKQTDVEGKVVFEAPTVVSDTVYSIKASKNGYLGDEIGIVVIKIPVLPKLNIILPDKIEGDTFEIIITDHTGKPMTGVRIIFNGKEYISGYQGIAILDTPKKAGNYEITVEKEGFTTSSVTVLIPEKAEFPWLIVLTVVILILLIFIVSVTYVLKKTKKI